MKEKKINWKKYSKGDRKFLINLSIENRNFLTNVYIGLYTMLIAFTALLISICSIYVSIVGLNLNSLSGIVIISLLIIISWIFVPIYLKKIHKGIKNLNNQYQEIHKTIHPELFKGGYYY